MSFDAYASEYDAHLDKGIRLSGEGKLFFAQGRLTSAANYLRRSGVDPRRILEFGCGVGTNLGLMAVMWPRSEIIGLDQSEQSLKVASASSPSDRVRVMTSEQYFGLREGPVDWVFCNGVFHHIPVAARDPALRTIHSLLRPRGAFTVFENNPFNPGARWVMKRIPFDRDAQMIYPSKLERFMHDVGFDELETRFLFVFPRVVSMLRVLEPYLERLPAGAQYGVFGLRR